ncbi:CRAL-TRIO domain-containing protein [Hysterangium stoloniferum]|nr:CRAL-TRIO domain-containing protein [Hysterangium stoloniferum]
MSSSTSKDEILVEFRRQLESEGILSPGDTIGADDDTLLRFLRARKFDLKNAKVMFEKCQDWRKNVEGVGLDALYEEIDPFDYPERNTVFKYWPLLFHKKGRPINIQWFGQFDLNALYKEVTPERQWKAFLVNCDALTREILPECTKVKGETVNTIYGIIDLKGFSLNQFWKIKSIVRESFQISQDYYPETMGQLVVINAPATFTIIWTVIKPWLAPETVAKIDILGSDYTDTLLKHVDAENLPESLGGTCTCEGLGGCRVSSAGPWLDGRVYKGHGPSKYRDNSIGTENGFELQSEPLSNGHVDP